MSIDRLIIERATITDGDNVQKFDIANTITDIVIYEHIDKPYLTGAVSFLDNSGVLDKVKFKGLEQFYLTLSFPEDDRPSISRKFIIDRIIDTSKNNDVSEFVTFHIIEEHGFISTILNVNKAYKGNSRQIIEKIVSDYFTNISLSQEDDDQAKYDMQVIVPNMTPLEAMNWIKDRTTSNFGTPYYLFTVLGQPGKMHFLPLSTLISANVSSSQEYTFSQSTTQDAETSDNPADKYYTIKKYRQNPLEITKLIDAGLISSQQGFWDTAISSDIGSRFEIENTIGLVPGFDKDNFKFKNNYTYKDQSLNSLISRKSYSIHTSYPYSSKEGKSYYSFRELENLNRTMTAKALRNILATGSMDIVVSGRNFIIPDKNKSLGNLINLRFLNNQISTSTSDINDITDKVKSGKHMIYAVRHNIKKERYDVTLSCVKLENLK